MACPRLMLIIFLASCVRMAIGSVAKASLLRGGHLLTSTSVIGYVGFEIH